MSRAGDRQRGHQFERDVVRALKPIFPKARRNLRQTQEGGADISGIPFTVECKMGNAPPIYAGLKQAEATGPRAVVITKRTKPGFRTGPLVTMRLETWVDMLAAIYGVKDDSEIP